jgi:nucleotide-binding universal stress UspA family protein
MTDRAQPVLVGIDGTASGLEALALGRVLAQLTGGTLVLGAVCGFDSGTLTGELVWPPQVDAERWLAVAEQRLDGSVPHRLTTVLSTSVAHGLVTLARREGAQIIVLGSRRHAPIDRLVHGHTARRVAHGAPCAVAVVPHGWTDRPGPIGAAVTDSPESRAALGRAAHLAAAAQAPLRVFTAVRVASPANPMFATTGTDYYGWRDARLRHGEWIVHEAIATVAPESGAETVVQEGAAVDRLAEASRDLRLLVIGSRRYGPLRSALLGGVSSALLGRASCPLVIVPRGAAVEAFPHPDVEETMECPPA